MNTELTVENYDKLHADLISANKNLYDLSVLVANRINVINEIRLSIGRIVTKSYMDRPALTIKTNQIYALEYSYNTGTYNLIAVYRNYCGTPCNLTPINLSTNEKTCCNSYNHYIACGADNQLSISYINNSAARDVQITFPIDIDFEDSTLNRYSVTIPKRWLTCDVAEISAEYSEQLINAIDKKLATREEYRLKDAERKAVKAAIEHDKKLATYNKLKAELGL